MLHPSDEIRLANAIYIDRGRYFTFAIWDDRRSLVPIPLHDPRGPYVVGAMDASGHLTIVGRYASETSARACIRRRRGNVELKGR